MLTRQCERLLHQRGELDRAIELAEEVEDAELGAQVRQFLNEIGSIAY